ncbi:TOPRIM nucleotidyl transferase/hydrolase domain-containing protein [Vibrio parahaemolyticus]|uniref:TOPRIM nucleotidyl transferase/hydrolase domain-containing protein n=1 Tax=Vibrio parahaemolyticus TaxID=670 RepID=UPI00287AD798|nr:TOPRIM nucleotidyl transferase/hydrolase domain-containing protein [Vibrio parahaemolyticus]MDS1787283.1 hypothetical protein [Vibrio parahaemolyticus]
MSDNESIMQDAIYDEYIQWKVYDEAEKVSAIEQCIYLFVEGESEETAFRILLEEGLNIKFDKYGVVIANYNGIGNLKHTIRLMSLTLSHSRPMIFTFDDDHQSLISSINNLPKHVHLFKVPCKPVVNLNNGRLGGSFEESFDPKDFINACFETSLLRRNPQIHKSEFEKVFDVSRPFYAQIVTFLKSKGLSDYCPSKIEIAEDMACCCEPEPETYVKLAELIKKIRTQYPIHVKI